MAKRTNSLIRNRIGTAPAVKIHPDGHGPNSRKVLGLFFFLSIFQVQLRERTVALKDLMLGPSRTQWKVWTHSSHKAFSQTSRSLHSLLTITLHNFYFGGIRDWTQGLVHTKQACYHWVTPITKPFSFVPQRILLCYPGWPQTFYFYTQAPTVYVLLIFIHVSFGSGDDPRALCMLGYIPSPLLLRQSLTKLPRCLLAHSAAQAGVELVILLLSLSSSWDYRSATPNLALPLSLELCSQSINTHSALAMERYHMEQIFDPK